MDTININPYLPANHQDVNKDHNDENFNYEPDWMLLAKEEDL